MASGKLSPRQKMINMMYLVLTALLALQVSAEIMDAFQQIADTMRNSTQRMASKNVKLGKDIKNTIIQNAGGDKEAAKETQDWKYAGLIDQIIARTTKSTEEIENIREGLFAKEVAGVKDDNEDYMGSKYGAGLLKNPGETDGNYRYWMIGEGGSDTENDGAGSGKAIELRKILEGYVKWANKFSKEKFGESGPQFDKIVQDPSERLPDEPEYREARSHTWEYNTFHAMPAVANLATIEMYKQQMRVIESDLLAFIRSKLNKFEFKIDSLIPIAAPKSTVVVPGMNFEADVYVAATSTEAIPKFGGNVSANPKNPNMGKVSIPASVSDFGDRSKVTRAWSGTIAVTKADGSVTNMTVDGKYDIVRPSIQTISEAVNVVYLNCMNQTIIDVPLLSTNNLYNPVLSANGANKVVSSKSDPKKVSLLPIGGGKRMVVNVASMINGRKINIGSVKFGVQNPPKPDIQVFVNKKPVITGAKVARNATAQIRVVPDKDFARNGLKMLSIRLSAALSKLCVVSALAELFHRCRLRA